MPLILAALVIAGVAVAPARAPAGIRDAGIAEAGRARSGDSLALERRVRAAVDSFERAAYLFWSPTATRCAEVAANCWGGECLPSAGRAPCIVGRELPCRLGKRLPPSEVVPFPVDTTAECRDLAHDPQPPRFDSAQVFRAREHLLAVLDSAAAALPGDAWVAGQRVLYLTLAGRADQAIGAAHDCRAAAWWCAALTGFALHDAGDDGGADSAFRVALIGAPEVARCRLTDVSLLLDTADTRARARYGALPCGSAERRAFEERFWWLADPSWFVGANDRWTEHLARAVERTVDSAWGGTVCPTCKDFALIVLQNRPEVRVQGRLLAMSTSLNQLIRSGANDSFWIMGGPHQVIGFYYYVLGGGDPRDSINRRPGGLQSRPCSSYRPPCWDTMGVNGVTPGTPGRFARSTVARYHFVPDPAALADPVAAADADWDLTAGPAIGFADLAADAPVRSLPERFTPAYAPAVTQLHASQIAYFKRGDSALLVSAVDVSQDSLMSRLNVPGSDAIGGAPTAPAAPWQAGVFTYWHVPAAGLPRDSVVDRFDGPPRATWIATLAAPWDSALYGFEILVPRATVTGGALARTRFGIAPPVEPAQRVQLSDLLFYAPDSGDPPHALVGPHGALATVLGTTNLGKRTTVGVFWETYGLRPNETGALTLTVEPRDPGGSAISRMVRRLLGRVASAPVHLVMRDQAPTDRTAAALAAGWGRGVALEVGALPAGAYTLRLALAVEGQRPVEVTREFTLARVRGRP